MIYNLSVLVPIISTLLGAIVGFLLSWFKDYLIFKPRLRAELKRGNLSYYLNKEINGFLVREIESSSNADIIEMELFLDIFNLGKAGTGIKDILIGISVKKDIIYYTPKCRILYDNKTLEDVSFNVEGGKIQTIITELTLILDEENKYLFDSNLFDPDDKNRFKIIVVLKSIDGKEVKVKIDPLSILTA